MAVDDNKQHLLAIFMQFLFVKVKKMITNEGLNFCYTVQHLLSEKRASVRNRRLLF